MAGDEHGGVAVEPGDDRRGMIEHKTLIAAVQTGQRGAVSAGDAGGRDESEAERAVTADAGDTRGPGDAVGAADRGDGAGPGAAEREVAGRDPADRGAERDGKGEGGGVGRAAGRAGGPVDADDGGRRQDVDGLGRRGACRAVEGTGTVVRDGDREAAVRQRRRRRIADDERAQQRLHRGIGRARAELDFRGETRKCLQGGDRRAGVGAVSM